MKFPTNTNDVSAPAARPSACAHNAFNWNNGKPSIFCPKQKPVVTPEEAKREKLRLLEAARRAAKRVNTEQHSCTSNATKSERAPR